MGNIQKYISEIISGKREYNCEEFKDMIIADHAKSGIKLFDNDSCAPFVQSGSLAEILTDRIYEGEHGQVSYDRVSVAMDYYDKQKKQDRQLSFAFNYRFSDVGNVDKTYDLFERAIIGCRELSANKEFGVRAKDKTTEKSFTAQETLVVENMARFEEMFEAEYGKKPYEDAVSSTATILLLRALAQKGEEDAIDNLAEQLYPFITRSIKTAVAKKDYIGDKKLYAIALELAEERLEKLNRALGKDAINVDLESLKKDARIFAELGRVNNKFKDYHINIYGVGTNPPISYVNKYGEMTVPDKVGDEIYDVIEDINDKIIGSVIDTHEEVFVSMLCALIHVETSDNYTPAGRAQLELAFALPLVQAANFLKDEKARLLINATIEKLAVAKDIEIDKKVFAKGKQKKGVKGEPVVEEPVVEPIVEEPVVETVPTKRKPKPLTIEDVRKKFIKKFVSANNQYYNKIGEGKIKKEQAVIAHDNVAQIAGILGLEGKRLAMQPAEYVAMPKISKTLPTAVVTEFANAYLVSKAEEIIDRAGDSEEEIAATKKEIDDTRKEIGKFYTSRVKHGQISVEQVLGRDDK